MAGVWKIPSRAAARYFVLMAGLVAGFLLDASARAIRPEALAAVPRWLLRAFSQVGEIETLAPVILVILVHGLITHQAKSTRAAAVLAVAFIATAIVVVPLKWLASRGPEGVFHGFGAGGHEGIMFPSGHAALAFAACAVVAAVWREVRWPAWIIAMGVAIARVILVHFLSDVVAGAFIGAAVGQGVAGLAVNSGLIKRDNSELRIENPELKAQDNN